MTTNLVDNLMLRFYNNQSDHQKNRIEHMARVIVADLIVADIEFIGRYSWQIIQPVPEHNKFDKNL